MGPADREPAPGSPPVRELPDLDQTTDVDAGRAADTARPDVTTVRPPAAVRPDDDTGSFFAAPPPAAPADDEGTQSFVPLDPLDPAAPVPVGETRTYDYGAAFSPAARRRRAAVRAAAPPGYELLGELGRGGMGVVYKARQVKLNRTAALKMILGGAHAGAQQLARFQTEAEAAARLTHPNIVQVYESGEHEGLPYFALEFVDGGPLSKKTKKEPQPPRQAAEMVATLARAIQFAHDHRVIHRDIKPANVLVGSDGTLKIADFGLAKKLEEADGQTLSGTIVGTPQYMAPEQARGDTRHAGPAADQYSLGAVLYELLVGRPPFVGASVVETLDLVQKQEPVPVRDLQPKVPIDLETVCLKALQKDPARRYGSCGELADDLDRFLAGRPIVARPVGPAERAWRWCRRNPRVAALTAGVAALLLFITGGSVFAANRLNTLRGEADEARGVAVLNEQKAKENEQKANDNAALAAANQKEAEKNADLAAKSQKAAEAGEAQALALARQSVDTLLIAATDIQNELKRRPGTQELRVKLFDLVEGRLDLLAKTIETAKMEPATAAKFFRALSAMYQRRGDYARDLAPPQTAKAAALYQQAKAINVKLADGSPADPVFQFNLAVILDKQAQLALAVGDVAAARRDFADALARREALLKVDAKAWAAAGAKVDIPLLVTSTREKLGKAHLLMGDPAAAAREYAAALDARRAGSPAGPPPLPPAGAPAAAQQQHSTTVRNWAGVYDGLGEAAARLGDPAAARGHFEKALDLRQSRAGVAKPFTDDRRDVAACYDRFGTLALLHGNDPPAALKWYDDALGVRRKLLAEDPDSATAVRDVADSLYWVGTAKLRAGDRAGALAAYRECRDRRRKLAADPDRPNDQGLQIELMLALARCGEHAEAAALAAGLEATAAANPGWQFFVGCGYALCTEADDAGLFLRRGYEAAAVRALGAAVDQGWKDRVGLDLDPDLDPVRDRAGFRAVRDRVPAPKK